MRFSYAACVILFCCGSAPVLGGLVITEVASSSGAPAPLTDLDWWELTNTGPNPVLLDNYAWEDRPVSNDRAIFPSGITMAVGESIIIHEMQGDVSVREAFRAAWNLDSGVRILEESQFTGANTFSGLSGNGDEVHLFDGMGNEIAAVSFGSATIGVTFEWSADGTSLGVSVSGENGALTSTYGGVASPGFAVPEPSGLFLCLIGLLVGCRRRCD